MDKTKSGPWEVFGKISAVLAVITMVIGIKVAIFPSSEELKGIIDYSQYAVSPDLWESLSNLKDSSEDNGLRQILRDIDESDEKIKLDYEMIESLSEGISKSLDQSWSEKFKARYNNRIYEQMVSIKILNDGDIAAKNVVLDMPLKGIAILDGQDGKEEVLEIVKSVKLGDVRPNNQVSLVMWSENSVAFHNEDEFYLSHESGIGEIEFVIKATGIDSFLIDYKFGIFMLFLLLLWFAVASLSLMNSQDESSKKIEDESKEI